MDDLYKIGQTVGQENAGAPQAFNPMQGSAFADAMADPKLAELLGGGGDIEQYLQQYEQMLAEGAGGGARCHYKREDGRLTETEFDVGTDGCRGVGECQFRTLDEAQNFCDRHDDNIGQYNFKHINNKRN